MSQSIQNQIEYFYASKEQTHCPQIPELIRIGKWFENYMKCKHIQLEVFVSRSFGKRVLINTPPKNITNASIEDFVEIIDFDPVRNTMLLIGQKQPSRTSAIHWYIHNTLSIDGYLLEMIDQQQQGTWKKIYPNVKNAHSIVDTIKNILHQIKKNQIIALDTKSVFILLKDIKELDKIIPQLYEE